MKEHITRDERQAIIFIAVMLLIASTAIVWGISLIANSFKKSAELPTTLATPQENRSSSNEGGKQWTLYADYTADKMWESEDVYNMNPDLIYQLTWDELKGYGRVQPVGSTTIYHTSDEVISYVIYHLSHPRTYNGHLTIADTFDVTSHTSIAGPGILAAIEVYNASAPSELQVKPDIIIWSYFKDGEYTYEINLTAANWIHIQ